MCLAVPGELLDLSTENGLPTGRVSFGGVIKLICLAYTPEATPGDYVLVHAGFSISTIDETEAVNRLASFGDIALQGGGA